jgi:hypothetical protein
MADSVCKVLQGSPVTLPLSVKAVRQLLLNTRAVKRLPLIIRELPLGIKAIKLPRCNSYKTTSPNYKRVVFRYKSYKTVAPKYKSCKRAPRYKSYKIVALRYESYRTTAPRGNHFTV